MPDTPSLTPVDPERSASLVGLLEREQLDALIVARPGHVLLVTGAWPVLGRSVAVVSRDGRAVLLVPEDEADLAGAARAEVRTYATGSLERILTVPQAVLPALRALLRDLGLVDHTTPRVGYETTGSVDNATYAAHFRWGAVDLPATLEQALPGARWISADAGLAALMARPTARERARIADACATAGRAFMEGRHSVRAGATERRIAAQFEAAFAAQAPPLTLRAGGFAWCMSGPRAAEAGRAYARSSARAVARGELVLVHANSYVDGFWTDITRTWVIGDPDPRLARMLEAVAEARAAALAAIAPGVAAAAVDRAARSVLEAHGFGDAFTHGTGHGVGFAAIDHTASPRLHPASDDVLEAGMVFNVEPAIYIPGLGGVRHCDVVELREAAAEVLTPFHCRLEDLVVA